jgi:hypothetical protein
MALKLLRTIRLDPSDGFVFERAAEPGEIAVVGSFLFWGCAPDSLAGKQLAAFRSGFLGVSSFGWSTLAVVSEVAPAERDAAVAELAGQLMARLGAPDRVTAEKAAAEEIAFAATLCDPSAQTLVALQRRFEEDGIREQFRTLRPRDPLRHDHAFRMVAVEGEAEEEDGTAEELDIMTLARRV